MEKIEINQEKKYKRYISQLEIGDLVVSTFGSITQFRIVLSIKNEEKNESNSVVLTYFIVNVNTTTKSYSTHIRNKTTTLYWGNRYGSLKHLQMRLL